MKIKNGIVAVGLAISSLAVSLTSGAVPVHASFGVSWDSSFQVLNLSNTDPASIAMTYVNPDGSMATMDTNPKTGLPFSNPDTDVVSPSLSNTYFPIHAAAGFQGSVVIASDQQVAVVANLLVKTPQSGLGSYVGIKQGAAKIFFPLVMKGNANNTSEFFVQNASLSGSAVITITFTPAAGGGFASIPPFTDSIAANAAHNYDMNVMSQFTGITRWIGSVTVEVKDPANSIAGVANTVSIKYPTAYQLATYNAFASGSTQVVLPVIQENNVGNRTSVNCQNISSSTPTTVTVAYTPGPSFPAKASEVQANVSSNATAVFIQDYTNTPGKPRFVGSAKVTSSPAVPLVCVVNQQNPIKGTIDAYDGFDPASATPTILLPLIQSRNGNAANGFVYTTINMATSDGSSQTVKCDFKPAPGFTVPTSQNGTGAAINLFQNDIYGNGNKFVGGAVCSLQSAPAGVGLFAVVNQTRQNTPVIPRDTLSSYDGFNQ